MSTINRGTQTLAEPAQEERLASAKPWVTIVFDDPVNLMTYVTYVFESYFGYTRSKAERLMRRVHEQGKAVVATGSREQMEKDTAAMHGFGLWAACRSSEDSS